MNKVTDLFPDKEPKKEKQIPLEELLESCMHCDFELKSSKIYQRYRICPNCNYHFSISARRRLATLIDKNSFHETSKWIQSLDPIEFSPRVSYRVRLVQDRIRTGLNEAIITGTCKIDDKDVFVTLMLAYKNKEMQNPVMQMIAGRLDNEQIASLALYFNTLK